MLDAVLVPRAIDKQIQTVLRLLATFLQPNGLPFISFFKFSIVAFVWFRRFCMSAAQICNK